MRYALQRVTAAGSLACAVLVLGVAAASPALAETPAFVPLEVRLTGFTQVLTDGDVILLDFEGRGHRLRASNPALGAQLLQYAGRRVTIVGTPVQSPVAVPNYPILVTDFRLEPGGSFDRTLETVSGVTERLPDGDVIIRDALGLGHRLRATGAIKAHLEETAGTRLTVLGRSSVTNAASRLNWPIDVLSVLRMHASRTGCFAGPPTTSGACFRVTGFGLEPGSDVRVFVNKDQSPAFHITASAEGTVDWTTAAGCFPAGNRQVALSMTAFATTTFNSIDASDSIVLSCAAVI